MQPYFGQVTTKILAQGTLQSGYITILDENNMVISSPGASEPVYVNGLLQKQQKMGNVFIHPHDVCVDADENLVTPQWNSGKTYPVF